MHNILSLVFVKVLESLLKYVLVIIRDPNGLHAPFTNFELLDLPYSGDSLF